MISKKRNLKLLLPRESRNVKLLFNDHQLVVGRFGNTLNRLIDEKIERQKYICRCCRLSIVDLKLKVDSTYELPSNRVVGFSSYKQPSRILECHPVETEIIFIIKPSGDCPNCDDNETTKGFFYDSNCSPANCRMSLEENYIMINIKVEDELRKKFGARQSDLRQDNS